MTSCTGVCVSSNNFYSGDVRLFAVVTYDCLIDSHTNLQTWLSRWPLRSTNTKFY